MQNRIPSCLFGVFLLFTLALPAYGEIIASLENPSGNTVSSRAGIGLISGWAFSTLTSELSVQVSIDGSPPEKIPCCSKRLDVGSADAYRQYPQASQSGFALLWNWGNLTPGQHTIQVSATAVGETPWSQTATVTVVKPGDFPFLSQFDLSQAQTRIEVDASGTQYLVIEGAIVTDKETGVQKRVTIRQIFSSGSQGFEIISSITTETLGNTQAQLAFAPDVAWGDQSSVRESIVIAEAYFRVRGVLQQHAAIQVHTTAETGPPPSIGPEGHISVAMGSTIYVYTGSEDWIRATPCIRRMAVVHNYVHAVNTVEQASWLEEAAAEFYGWWILRDACNFEEAHTYHRTIIRSDTSLGPLESYETWDAFFNPKTPGHTGIAFMAAYYLWQSRGQDSLAYYLDTLNLTADWHQAFLGGFQQSTASFYTEFAAWRADTLSVLPQIKGMVVNRNGAPIAGVYVYTCQAPWGRCEGATTVSTEQGYTVGAPFEQNILQFSLAPGASTPAEGFIGYYSTAVPTRITLDQKSVTPLGGDVVGINVELP
ncbi:MAG: hypothetical protein A2756_03455 [Candidatus Ryanbacteria bacterium RIFCSPHIGHO2_01_FULL_48_27]|uniref:Uncharacterized protein n=1 Tax=Candidatus Ryanbacteria bacterium RIFCSPHIGHO2_01_FULL_48_27 TaxID=1802115 RepID=A0A1G2G4A0_9BACT|nr:MAG: hypothetical protein A2756_03455 [Candidatus Ryanbacteria bacterium RIFCSPHIGHO2_01_FULL_48_27]